MKFSLKYTSNHRKELLAMDNNNETDRRWGENTRKRIEILRLRLTDFPMAVFPFGDLGLLVKLSGVFVETSSSLTIEEIEYLEGRVEEYGRAVRNFKGVEDYDLL